MKMHCGKDSVCEECNDKKSCDLYHKEINRRISELCYEEDWHEMRYLKSVNCNGGLNDNS